MSTFSGFVAGVDCSTQSTKVIVVDVGTGEVAGTGWAAHEVSGRHGARETRPEVWWEALATALAATGLASSIGALGVGGQQHGLVLLDDDDVPLRPAMLWNDVRSAPQAETLTAAWGGAETWAGRIGLVPVASFTVTKWEWVRHHEPETAAAARRVMLPHDYLNYRLTGQAVTDRGDASGTGWWSNAIERYSPEVLDLVRLDEEWLPEVRAHGGAAGEVSEEAGRRLGLRPGTVVSVGTGDNMAAALGLGVAPGEPVISLGTSGTAYAVSETPTADPAGVVAGFADATHRFLPLAATLNCTLAIDRVAGWLGLDRECIAAATDVVVLPYLDGERTPDLPAAAGTIVGLRHTTTREEILLAAYQGAVASLLEALHAIDVAGSGVTADGPVTLIGGGAGGVAWQRVVADLAGRSLLVPDAAEPVALGGAVQAASLITGTSPAAIAASWDTRSGPIVEPRDPSPDTLDHIRTIRQRAHRLLG